MSQEAAKTPGEDELCKQCGHPFEPHRMLGHGNPPTEGWTECPVPGCSCRLTWSMATNTSPDENATLETGVRPMPDTPLEWTRNRQVHMDIASITAIENWYCGQRGKPTLGRAYDLLLQRWDAGARDRETCLRLLFLAWYSCSEPVCFTGLPADSAATLAMFECAYDHLEHICPDDPEFLFAVGYMTRTFPECFGDEAAWEAFGEQCLARFRAVGGRLAAEVFESRGAYGEYFAHIVQSGWIEEFAARPRADRTQAPRNRPWWKLW